MHLTLTTRPIVTLIIVTIASASTAGYYHDQSIKGVYQTFAQLQKPWVDGWFSFDETQCYYGCYVR